MGLRIFVAAAVAMVMLVGAAQANPSGAGLPRKVQTDSFGTTFTRVGADNFTKDAPRGSWATNSFSKIVYTGDHGMKWFEYPDGWPCSGSWGSYPDCYRPKDVLSVHNGVLDYWLHQCTYPNGTYTSCGANPGPIFPDTGTRYRIHGRFEAEVKLTRRLSGYHTAWLLWPKNNAGSCAESDYPEIWMNQPTLNAFAHYGCHGSSDDYSARFRPGKWYTVTQEWGPGWRRYYLNRKLIGVSTSDVYSGPERWQLQVEVRGGTGSAHVKVDWVWIGKLG